MMTTLIAFLMAFFAFLVWTLRAAFLRTLMVIFLPKDLAMWTEDLTTLLEELKEDLETILLTETLVMALCTCLTVLAEWAFFNTFLRTLSVFLVPMVLTMCLVVLLEEEEDLKE